ncbi:MAG: aspartate aminotransferase family protein [Thermoplasmata archaeon]|nr:aspartate aminotransferase family protein [Thermoplasmatales archaeon]
MVQKRLSFEKAPVIREEPPGKRSLEILKKQDELETSARTYTRIFKFAIEEARGATVRDVDDNIFIDWFAGVAVMNMGHNHPDIRKALMDQMDRIVHIPEIPTEIRIEFLKNLNSTLPGKLKNNAKVLFTTTGADACEASTSLARYITNKRTIVAFGGAYHGISGGISATTGNYHYREFGGFRYENVHHLPYPYPYRFPLKVKEEDISKVVVDELEYLIKDPYAGTGPIAGVLVEPVQGEGGYVVPPDDFLPMLREITEKYSIPLIVDEVQTGVGRTGRIWASEHYDVTPDIMCISKGIGNGIPISMVVYKREYDENLPQGFRLGTYRGNPLGLAAGNAVLKILKKGEVLERVEKKGRYILERFREIQEKNDVIGDVRGIGYMVGVEIVKNSRTREPWQDMANKIKERMFKSGLLMHTCGHYSNVLRFMAPLIIEDDLIEKGIDIFQQSIKEAKGK